MIAYVYYKISFVGHEEEVPGYQALYICTNDQGGLYIKRGENSEEVNEYIKTVSTQDDVVEFNNKITVEYNELMVDHPEVLQYISELDSQVSIAVGEKLANQVAGETQVAEAGTEEAQHGRTGYPVGKRRTEGGRGSGTSICNHHHNRECQKL